MTRSHLRERRLRAFGSGVLLAFALLIVGMVAYLPHLTTQNDVNDDPSWVHLGTAYWELFTGEREDYPYPLHVDDNVHWVRMSAIQRHDTVHHPDPYVGGSTSRESFSLEAVHEKGFAVAFAQVQEMTGIPFIQLIRFAPTLFAMVTASLVWVALRPWAGAPLAAAFVALVPSSARFLGPAFLVPSAVGLAWIAAALALSRWATRDHGVFALTLLVGSWAFFIHLVDGVGSVLILAVALPLALRENRRFLITAILGMLLPLVWFYHRFSPAFQAEAEKFSSIPADYTVFDQIGIPMLFAWGLGCAFMVLRPPRGAARGSILTATVASFVIFTAFILNRRLDWDLYALYDRWHQPFALLLAIPVAYLIVEGVTAVYGLILTRLRQDHPLREGLRRRHLVAPLLALLLVIPAGAAMAESGLRSHLDERYYHVIDDNDWELFLAASSIGPTHEVFLTHPWKAPIYLAMTGKNPYTWLDPGAPPVRGEDYADYHMGRYADPVWLVERDISIVIEPLGAAEPFVELFPGIYILDPALAERLHAVREE